MNKLSTYLKATGRKQSDFAEAVGSTQATISKLISGTARPGLDLAAAIEAETGGAVPAVSWADPRPVAPTPRKKDVA